MAALCLPRTARLLRPADFTALRGRSMRISTRNFVAEYLATANTGVRLGMAVSRRVSKLAVVRNRIRRTIRESFRLRRATLPCVDVLLIARTQAAGQINAILRDDLETIWNKLAALKQSGSPGTMRAGS
jgi:ribonuclease P protein component